MRICSVLALWFYWTGFAIAEEFLLYDEKSRGAGTKWQMIDKIHSKDIRVEVSVDDSDSVVVRSEAIEEHVSKVEILSEDRHSITILKNKMTSRILDEENETKPEVEDVGVLGGRKLEFEYRFFQWNFRPRKEKWSEEELAEVAEILEVMNAEKRIYGGAKRKVGEIWKISAADWMSAGMDWKDLDGDVEMHFLEVVKYEGRKCALLEVVGNVEGTTLEEGENVVAIQGKVLIYRDLELLIDLSTEANLKWSCKSLTDEGGVQIDFNYVSKGKAVQVTP